jgi:hypothetical protein
MKVLFLGGGGGVGGKWAAKLNLNVDSYLTIDMIMIKD